MHCLEIYEFQIGREYWEEVDYREYALRVMAQLYHSADYTKEFYSVFRMMSMTFSVSGYSPLEFYLEQALRDKRWHIEIIFIMVHNLFKAGYRGRLHTIFDEVVRKYHSGINEEGVCIA